SVVAVPRTCLFEVSSTYRYLSSVLSFHATSTTYIYNLSLHDALPIFELQKMNKGDKIKFLTYKKDRSILVEKGGDTFTVVENGRSEEHTSELQSRFDLVCRLLLEKKKK